MDNGTRTQRSPIGWSIAVVIALVCGLTWLATAGGDLLPRILIDSIRMNQTLSSLFGGLIISLNLIARAIRESTEAEL
jgi:hypothetical protein